MMLLWRRFFLGGCCWSETVDDVLLESLFLRRCCERQSVDDVLFHADVIVR